MRDIKPRIRVVVVEDEPASLDLMRELLAEHPGLAIVGEARDVCEGVAVVRERGPDLVLLDVRLPDGDGFDLIEQVGIQHMPAVIFVTAFDDYAVRAFRVAAVDYVLKPLDSERVAEAIERASSLVVRWRSEGLAAKLDKLARALGPDKQRSNRLAVRETGVVRFVEFDDIVWIDAAHNYCRINTIKHGVLTLRRRLLDLEGEFDPEVFLRVHRSSIVNTRYVRELRMSEWGDYSLVLEGGQRLAVGRKYRSSVEAFL